ncbi:hypothetical protein AAEX28_01175 [Lentisphaerota bacterium WC36G]|nr:hypothetical protein LJT99_04055 [Lentisphaerae bacterium WC36]
MLRQILQNCIKELRTNTRGSENSARANFIADVIEEAVHCQEYDRAELILRDQMNLINTNDYESEEKIIYKNASRSRYIRTNIKLKHYDQYYEILLKYLRQLTAQRGTVQLDCPGIALTHRIWVGNPLTQDQIGIIKSANIALDKIWTDSKTGAKEELTHCIWTNRRELLSMASCIKGVVFRDVEELFDSQNPLYNHYLSFMAHKEYAFVSDLARIQACCKFGGLFMGIAWYNNFRSHPPKFAPTMDTIKVFTSYEDKATIIALPFSGTAYQQLEGYFLHQYRNYSAHLTTTSYVDCEMLYFGRPRHPLALLIAEKQAEYLNALGESRVPHVIKNYRKIMYENLVKDWQKFNNPLRFENHISDQVRQTQIANAGLITNVLALTQAFMDLGYFHFDSPLSEHGASNRYRSVTLDKRVQFKIDDVGDMMFCEELGLQRKASKSWLKVNLAKKISAET